MQETYFVAGCALVLLLNVLAAVLLARPLRGLCSELCGNSRRGGYFARSGAIGMVLLGVAASTLPTGTIEAGGDADALVRNTALQVLAGLAGALVGLFLLAAVLLFFIRRFEEIES